MRLLKKKFAMLVATAAMIVPIFGAGPAAADEQNGLVNVYVRDILNGNQITLLQNVNVGVAAAFCNINANVLSIQLQNNQQGNCPAATSSTQNAWVSFH
jgi:hypothetical protein